jgi:hypothetical protein
MGLIFSNPNFQVKNSGIFSPMLPQFGLFRVERELGLFQLYQFAFVKLSFGL